MNTDDNPDIVFYWFDKYQWELLAKLDPNGVDDSYEEWRKNASKAFSSIEATGQSVRKVSIKVSELQIWCNKKGIEPNSESRAEFAAMLAQRKYCS